VRINGTHRMPPGMCRPDTPRPPSRAARFRLYFDEKEPMSTLTVNSKGNTPTPSSTAKSSAPIAAQIPAVDPSMEDIFADIRRTLAEEEVPPARAQSWQESSETAPFGVPAGMNNNVVVLDNSMMVTATTTAPSEAISPPPESAPVASPVKADLVAPETADAAAQAVGKLVRTMTTERTMRVGNGGPTVEDIVRDTVRTLVKEWLDAKLPHIVERLVRVEIERLVERAV
jgi:cell pole-organizing protein PopZ